jgi:hypothetical protein
MLTPYAQQGTVSFAHGLPLRRGRHSRIAMQAKDEAKGETRSTLDCSRGQHNALVARTGPDPSNASPPDTNITPNLRSRGDCKNIPKSGHMAPDDAHDRDAPDREHGTHRCATVPRRKKAGRATASPRGLEQQTSPTTSACEDGASLQQA